MPAKILTPLLAALTSLALGACSLSALAAERVSLQLRWKHQAQFIGYYVAKHKGYYQDAGFEVDILPGGAGIIPWQQLTNNQVTFAVDNTNAFAAYQLGSPLVALAAILQHSPSAFLAKQDSGIRSIADFRGRRVMMFPGGQDPELSLTLKKAGLELEEVEVIATSTDLTDLLEGRVDVFNAYSTNEPYKLTDLGIPYTLIKPRDYGIDFYSDILLTRQDYAQKHSDRVSAFTEASLAGWRYALDNPVEALDILLANYPTLKSRDHLRYELDTIRELVDPDFVTIGHMNPLRWEKISQLMNDTGNIPQHFDIDGFIYTPEQRFTLPPKLAWFSAGGAIIFALLVVIALLWRSNRKLRVEISDARQAEETLRYQANHDSLTQLANRASLTYQLNLLTKLARRNQCTPAVLYIDLDGFKYVNDQHGHHIGDIVLARFVKRAKATLRETDILGRLGGDEFLILAPDTDRDGAAQLAKKVIASMKPPFLIQGIECRLSASVGIALYENHNETPSSLLNRADRAMYYMKNNGKSGICFAAPFRDDSLLANTA